MARIGLVSDTHIPKAAGELPGMLLEGLVGVDMILHAGDILELGVLERLERIAPVHAVSGNMDPRDTSGTLPETLLLEVEGFKVGLVHGGGAPWGIVRRVAKQVPGADCIVFGHTHAPLCEVHHGVLMVNPGTPTDRRFARVNSYAILTVTDGLSAEIVELPRPPAVIRE